MSRLVFSRFRHFYVPFRNDVRQFFLLLDGDGNPMERILKTIFVFKSTPPSVVTFFVELSRVSFVKIHLGFIFPPFFSVSHLDMSGFKIPIRHRPPTSPPPPLFR